MATTFTATPKQAQSTEQKTFTISKLPEVERLDDEDLFLMTDKEGDKVYTRKLKLSHLVQFLGDNPDLIRQIIEQDELDQQIQTKVETKVDEALKITEIYGGNSNGFTTS